MFDIVPGVGWLLLAYAVGTAYGWWVNRSGVEVIEKTIDNLIENGYLKHRKDAKGDIEILKYNEE
jgi:hypothetical protein|tara:strand:- start:295 stop:489 length:195 start_codon:yes stop_codon:yes gene_type:complete